MVKENFEKQKIKKTMAPQKYIMQPVPRGDQWTGVPTITIKVNGLVPAVPLASARMQFRKFDKLGAELSTGAGIDIVSAAGWELSIPAQSLPLGAGKWDYDLEAINTDGAVKTYVEGSINIKQDITK